MKEMVIYIYPVFLCATVLMTALFFYADFVPVQYMETVDGVREGPADAVGNPITSQNTMISAPTTASTSETGTTQHTVMSDQEKTEDKALELQNNGDLSGFKIATTTVFWVGEDATPSNNFIPNHVSAWDVEWEERFGGLDDPEDRCGYHPCGFTPKENPFYFALPYNEFTLRGVHRPSVNDIPWFPQVPQGEPLLKNRWIMVQRESHICYAQWEDVGPYESNDFEYVFGQNEMPQNILGAKAGLDISPAVRDCLQVGGISRVYWKFIDFEEVPPGPWKDIVTRSGINW